MRYVFLLLLTFGVLPVQSQHPRYAGQDSQQELSAADSARAARFRLAQSFSNAAQLERAIAILEDLYGAYPTDEHYFNALKDAYEAVKRYTDAIVLAEAAIARSGAQAKPGLVAERARLRYLSGDESGALTDWNGILFAPEAEVHHYRLVYESMMQVRLFDRAIVALEHGRTKLQHPKLFQIELAYLHSLLGDHDKAMEEYLGLLHANAQQLNYVRSQLGYSLQQEGAMEASLPIIESRVVQDADNRSFRELYAWMLVGKRRFFARIG